MHGGCAVEDPYSYNQLEVLISDQFTISNPAPPPAPVPVPVPAPVPAPPATADVTGTVSSKGVTNGVKLAFKSAALPVGTVVGKRLSWTVLVDRKIRKSFSQGPSAIRNLKVTSPDRSGRHVVKILRNGKAFKTFRYTA